MTEESGKSRYRELAAPEFHSNVPPHLLNKLTETEKWIIESLSVIQTGQAWQIEQVLECNRIDREIDGRLEKLEEWKSYLSGRVAITAVIAGIILTGTVGFVFKVVAEKIVGP